MGNRFAVSFDYSMMLRRIAAMAGLLFLLPAISLRAADAPATVKSAIGIAGRTVDETGQPLAGAEVTARIGRGDEPTTQLRVSSDAKGEFILRQVAAGEWVSLIAYKSGRAPASATATAAPKSEPVELVLSPGRSVSGIVTDARGLPLPDVAVTLQMLQGLDPSRISAGTDADGRFEIEHVPETYAVLAFRKTGYMDLPVASEALVPMKPVRMGEWVVIAGNVIDAKTRQPIPHFSAMGLLADPSYGSNNSRTARVNLAGGKFQMQLGEPGDPGAPWEVVISSPGYFTTATPQLRQSGTQDVELEPGTDITGRVLGPDGKPLPGVRLVAADPREMVSILNGTLMRGNINTTSNADGTFDLPPQRITVRIYAAGDDGYLSISSNDLKKNSDVRLAPWGRIQGRVMVHGKPAAGQHINAQIQGMQTPSGAGRIQLTAAADTDADGNYTLEKLVPGDYQISRQVPNPGPDSMNLGGVNFGPAMATQSPQFTGQIRNATVAAGATATVDFGLEGRPVVGTMQIPDDLINRRDWLGRLAISTITRVRQPVLPADVQASSPADRQKWLDEFYKTGEGKALAAARVTEMASAVAYTARIDPNGAFRIDDVIPGNYRANITVTARAGGQFLEIGSTTFTMPPVNAAPVDEPLTLGEIEVSKQGIGVPAGALQAPAPPANAARPVPARIARGPATAPSGRATTPALTGTVIGGQVTDEQAKPLADSTVNIQWTAAGAMGGDAGQPQVASVKTDESGRWKYSGVPRNMAARVALFVSHDGYLTRVEFHAQPFDLLNQQLIIALSRGVDLAGLVVDGAAKPVAGAVVSSADDQTKTDALGDFVLNHLQPSATVQLTVTASGFAPAFQRVTLPAAGAAKGDPIQIIMLPGRTLSGHVTNPAGEPVGGVKVALLARPGGANFQFTTTTDARGHFEMPDAPMDAITFDLTREGYSFVRPVFQLGQDHREIVLNPLTSVHGKVIDAQTRQPINGFRILIGWKNKTQDQPTFSPLATGKDGQYEQTINAPPVPADWYVRIEADGYLPAIAGPLRASAANALDFELKKGVNLTGRVLASDGKPAPGTDVVVLTSGQMAVINNGRIGAQRNLAPEQRCLTDADGKFSLPPQDGKFVVLAAGDAGYARVDQTALAASSDVTLQPWGRLQGRVAAGQRPSMRVTVSLAVITERYPSDEQQWQFATSVDATGQYRFDRVPAGIAEVSMNIFEITSTKQAVLAAGETAPATISGGDTVTLDLGAEGQRPVVGRVVLTPALPAGGGRETRGWARSVPRVGDPPMPDLVRLGSRAGQQKWWIDFLQTDDGQAYALMSCYHQQYYVDVATDGKFRIDGAVPGKYQLSIEVMPPNSGSAMASGGNRFTVTAPSPADGNAPVELPDIAINIP